MKEKINFYGYPIDLTYGRGQKNIYLRIHPSQGKISLSLDQRLGKKGALAFLEDKKDWLFQRISPDQVLEDPAYIEGERHFLWGRAYPLRIVLGQKRNRVGLREGELLMSLKEDLDREGREALLLEFYRSQVKTRVPDRLAYWSKILGLYPKDWRVKKMTSRWGTCNPRDQRIWLSLYLAQRPYQALDYVLVHELVHFMEDHHNQAFYAYLDRFFPQWKEVEAALNRPLKG